MGKKDRKKHGQRAEIQYNIPNENTNRDNGNYNNGNYGSSGNYNNNNYNNNNNNNYNNGDYESGNYNNVNTNNNNADQNNTGNNKFNANNLGDILNNIDINQVLGQVSQMFGGGGAGAPQQAPSAAVNAPAADPRIQLIQAMKPFLNPRRGEIIDRVGQFYAIARIVQSKNFKK